MVQAISKEDAGLSGARLSPGEALPIAIGDVIDGKYTVDAMIGIGGMGVVVAATHVNLGQRVAMKVMRTSRMNHETADRFLREARAAVSLKSSHVAKVLDVGMLDSGLPYMVMELLEGEDLAAKLATRGALPYGEAVDYVLQACDAISEAHALGIVHRDLKPENLFVTARRDGTALVKVLDFGISKVTSTVEVTDGPTSRRAVTHESTVMGSPMYMSPEQIRSAKHVDGRTDVWALGAILYELVAGHGAFWAESVPDIFVKVLEKPPPKLEDAVRDAPPRLAHVIARCLDKNVNSRLGSVHELAIELANLGARATTPTIPPWDRSVEVALTDADIVPVEEPNEPAPLDATRASAEASAAVRAPSPPRGAAAETFVLPDRRSRKKPLLVAAAIVAFVGAVLGGVVWYGQHMAAASAAAAAGADAPPSSSAAASSVGAPASTTTNAAADTDSPPLGGAPANQPPAQQPAKASAANGDGARRPGSSRPRGTSGSGAHAPSSPVDQGTGASTDAVTSKKTAPSPVPTLRRTDW
jgi:serine/threonine-protein kinase